MRLHLRHWVLLLAIATIAACACSCGGFFVDPTISVIAVNPATPSLLTGQTMQFRAVATYSDATVSVLGSATWTSSNAAVLLINQNGVGTAVSAGSATVTATSGTGSGSTTVTVAVSPLTSIAVTPVNPTISRAAQTTQQFAAVGTFGDGSSGDITATVTWSSSNTAAATIGSNGLANLVGNGTTTIKAVSGTVSGTSVLTVTP